MYFTHHKKQCPYLWLSLLFFCQLLLAAESKGQQVPDTNYRFSICKTAYPIGLGPVICIDEAHNNFHTKDSGYLPFGKLLEDDGYVVKSSVYPFENVPMPGDCEILVIANVLHESNLGNWVLPTPSALSETEINNIKNWVEDGGSLLLIADHMPFAGAASELAEAFGFEFLNGFAMKGNNSPLNFTHANNLLKDSPITSGIKEHDHIHHVATFTGSAFKIPKGAQAVLSFSENYFSLQPDTAWSFHPGTPSVTLENYFQGAILNFGSGKVAVFGEAAMFTAQLVNGNTKVGFNSDYAPQNAQFTLNLIHWLDGLEEYTGTSGVHSSSGSEREILMRNREMEKAFMNNNFQKVAAFYSDDAVMVGNKHEVKGRENIDGYWNNLKDRGINWELVNTDIEIHHNVAIQRGISRMKFLHQEKEHLSEVRFTLFWKRIDGEWLIKIDHYSLL